MCLRATGGPNRRPGPNQPGTPAPGGRGTDAPRPPPVRTRFNGTTAPDVGFRARRGSGAVGGRGEGERREQLDGNADTPCVPARPSFPSPSPQVYSKRARQRSSELATMLLISNIGKQGCSSANVAGSPLIDQTSEDSPRAGRRATCLPRATKGRAARSPSAISMCGRRPIAPSGPMGFLLRTAVGISRIASSWDSLNSE